MVRLLATDKALAEQIANAVLLIGPQHRILDANARALAMLGYTRDQLAHLTLHQLLCEHERHRIDSEMPALLAGTVGVVEREHLRRDGSTFPAEVSALVLGDGRYIKVIRDISARRAHEKALLDYQRQLSQLTHRLLSQERLTTQRVAQALHDQLGQTLAAARLSADAVRRRLPGDAPVDLRDRCARLCQQLDNAVREVRGVLGDLRSPLLEQEGLALALDNELRQLRRDEGPVLSLEQEDAIALQRWPADVEYAAFMIAREAVSNALRHAAANEVRVVLQGGANSLWVEVQDDGVGARAETLRGRRGHLGIVSMRERALAIGGSLDIDAGDPCGTTVRLRWSAPA